MKQKECLGCGSDIELQRVCIACGEEEEVCEC